MLYTASRINLGMIMNAYNSLIKPFSLRATFNAAVERVKMLLFSTRTNELKSFTGKLLFNNISCANGDCNEAKRKICFESCRITYCTLALQRLQMPSNKIIGWHSLFMLQSY